MSFCIGGTPALNGTYFPIGAKGELNFDATSKKKIVHVFLVSDPPIHFDAWSGGGRHRIAVHCVYRRNVD